MLQTNLARAHLHLSPLLLINIAKRPINSAHQLFDLPLLPIDIHDIQIYHILERLRLPTAHHTRASRNNLLPVCKVLRLPDIPRAIDHAMVQPEGRVARRDVEVGPWVPGDCEVAAAVHAVLALHVVLEGADVCGARDEGGDFGCRGVACCQVVGDVTFDAARVVAEAVRAGVLCCWLSVGHRCSVGIGGGLRGVVSAIAAIGPRFTFMSLNGPFSMQPPPWPAGFSPLLEWLVLMPWPLMLVSLPSKMGDVSGLDAHRPQSQYCFKS